MKVIVTGATGSCAGAIVRYLSKAGYSILATGRMRNPPKALLKIADYLQVDITKPFSLPKADVCIHAAAFSDDKAPLNELIKPNVEGTKNTLEAAKNCQKFIQISSSSVYLPSPNLLTEDMAGQQNNKQLSPYGMSKLMAENVIREQSKQATVFILRPRAFYGVGDKMILPKLLKIEKKGVLYCPGKMNVKISMTHYSNLAKALELCIKSNKKGLHIYNISDEKNYILIEVVRQITKAIYGKELDEKRIPILLFRIMAIFKLGGISPLLVRTFTNDMVLDISKIKQELGYKEMTNLKNSITELTNWVTSIGGVEVIKKATKDLAWK